MAEENKICQKCNSKMIKRSTGVVLTSYPPQYPWYWWCGCGHTERGGVERGKTNEEIAHEEWEKLNIKL